MKTIRFVQKRLNEDFHNVRFSAGDMQEVLNEMFGTNPPGIVMKFSEIERQIRTRELNYPVEIMRELQVILCEIAGTDFHFIDRIPEEEVASDEHKKREVVRLITSGMTRVGGKHYRAAEKDLMEMSLDSLHEIWRFIRDAEEQERAAVNKARREPWRRG
jgi:hypothetical protein